MTTDETRNSTLRGNRNAIWGVGLAIVLIAIIALLTLVTWGAVLLIPLAIGVVIALGATFWVIGMKGRRR